MDPWRTTDSSGHLRRDKFLIQSPWLETSLSSSTNFISHTFNRPEHVPVSGGQVDFKTTKPRSSSSSGLGGWDSGNYHVRLLVHSSDRGLQFWYENSRGKRRDVWVRY